MTKMQPFKLQAFHQLFRRMSIKDTGPAFASIGDKYNLAELATEFSVPLKALANVHRMGVQKYQIYSWLVNPEQHDGSTTLCLQAALRHLAAYQMGYINDGDTPHLNHLNHFICRLGMAAISAIRECTPDTRRDFSQGVESSHSKIVPLADDNFEENWCSFILPEHLIGLALGKSNPELLPYTTDYMFGACLYTYLQYTGGNLEDEDDYTGALRRMITVCVNYYLGLTYYTQVHNNQVVAAIIKDTTDDVVIRASADTDAHC